MDKSNLNKTSLTYRRLFYFGVFLIFFIAGPIISLYAAGYRFDPRTTRLTKVGAFYIKSFPAGSLIFLDGKPTGKKTPNRIFNLLPGIHTLRVSREGYESWQKNLDINPGQTNFTRDIVLFKKNPTALTLSTGGTDFLAATTAEFYIFLDSEKKIHLTSILSDSDYHISDLAFDKLYDLSSDNSKLLVSSGPRLSILDINTEKTQSVMLPSNALITKVSWGVTNEVYWVLSHRRLYRSDVIARTISEKLNEIDDFISSGDMLYTLSNTDGSAHLKAYDSATLKLLWEKKITTNDNIKLGEISPDGIITVAGQHSLWTYDHRADEMTFFEAKKYEWHDQRLLYANDFEIYVYDNLTKKNELIDRSSKQTIDVHWHPSGSYILRRIDSELELIELDGRDVRNRIFEANATGTLNVSFDKKGSKLYVLTPHQNISYKIQ